MGARGPPVKRPRSRGRNGDPGEDAHERERAHQRLGRHAEAALCFRDALAIRARDQAVRGQGETHAALAALFAETGDHDRALAHCRQAIDLATRMHDDVVLCDASTTAAEVGLATGRTDTAAHDAQRAADLSREMGDPVRRERALAALEAARG